MELVYAVSFLKKFLPLIGAGKSWFNVDLRFKICSLSSLSNSFQQLQGNSLIVLHFQLDQPPVSLIFLYNC